MLRPFAWHSASNKDPRDVLGRQHEPFRSVPKARNAPFKLSLLSEGTDLYFLSAPPVMRLVPSVRSSPSLS